LLDEAKMRRLAMIQYMYTMAIDQSRQPEPINMIGLLLFHDAVELFVALVSEHLHTGKIGLDVMAYWEFIDQKLPTGQEFGHKDSMARLSKARGSWKHLGMRISATEIDDFRANVVTFFRENTPKVFGIDFEEISMVLLVQNEVVRDRLTKAQELNSTGEITAALSEVAIAFEALFDQFTWKALEERSIYIQAFTPRRFASVKQAASSELAQFASTIDDAIDALHKQVRLLSFGIDYRRYLRFRGLTPIVHLMNDRQYHVFGEGRGQTYQDYLFCSQFVIECALRLQELQLF
jgi:hypothetical protein